MLTAVHPINYQSENPDSLSRNLVFIDSQVYDFQTLVSGIYEGIDTVIIPENQDGIKFITATLENYTNSPKKLDAIHIFSHGSPGSLSLGNILVNIDTLKLYESQFQKWQAALKQTADILLYGCNIAAGMGEFFVNQLQELTKANIAASVNSTGSYPGDWDLEFTTGKITAAKVLKPEIMAAYHGILGTITVTNNNDSGTGSLRQAIANANPGDTIQFDSSLANQTITLTTGQLEIKKDLIIDGANAANITISGNNASRVIDLQLTPDFESPTLTIKNLTIADGKTTEIGKPGTGAGIRTEQFSELIVENTTFINNTASGLGGGAIYSGYKSKATIVNSKFDNNDSSQALDNYGNLSEHGGGAILIWSESELTIQGSEFTKNKGVNGGAINNLLSKLTIEDSIFQNNDSTPGGITQHGYGGAIYTDGASLNDGISSGTISISNSIFEANRAAGQGGGLFLFAYPPDKILVENSTIIDNYVIKNSKGDSLGGGLRAGNGELTVNNTTFANNLALSQGGGLWVGENAKSTVTNSTFSGNNALNVQLDANQKPIVDSDGNYVLDGESDGIAGAMTLYVPTNIINSTFANNYAGFMGGAFWGDTSATTTNSIYDNNRGGNPYNIKHQTGAELNDGGGNIQYPGLSHPDDIKVTANITVADPQLGELQEINGILVHPLLAGSPAIDAGVNANAPTTDQLGNTRPVDGDENGSALIDIGAFEFILTPTPESCITGDDSDNLLNGTPQNDCIHGLGGNDTINGDDSNDTLNGDSGDDIINANAGDDTLNGGDHNDTLGGGVGNDEVNGELGDDLLTGSTGKDLINGGDGFDTLEGGDDEDTLNGGADADTLKGGTGNDLLNGDSGDDVLEGQADDDELNGGDGNDTVGGGDGNDLVNGDAGNDLITGLVGDDSLFGGANDDTINGGEGNDIIGGGADNDELNGDIGNDSLTGWLGNDIINGGDGFDTLQGGDDADTLNGGADADTLKGGTGSDLLNGDAGDDFIQGQAGDDILNGGEGNDTVGGGNNNDIVNGNGGNDSLTGWFGNDILTGGSGDDIVKGGDGLDTLNGEQGTDILTGGSNSDRFIFDIGSQFNLADMGSDIINDFTSAELDKIVLDKTTFTSLNSAAGNGFSVIAEFGVVDSNAAAATSSAEIVYNSANGQLFYNPNGNADGFGSGGMFATLDGAPQLEANDFIIQS